MSLDRPMEGHPVGPTAHLEGDEVLWARHVLEEARGAVWVRGVRRDGRVVEVPVRLPLRRHPPPVVLPRKAEGAGGQGSGSGYGEG